MVADLTNATIPLMLIYTTCLTEVTRFQPHQSGGIDKFWKRRTDIDTNIFSHHVNIFNQENNQHGKTQHQLTWKLAKLTKFQKITTLVNANSSPVFLLLRSLIPLPIFMFSMIFLTDSACPTHSQQLLFSQAGDPCSWQTGGGQSNLYQTWHGLQWFYMITTNVHTLGAQHCHISLKIFFRIKFFTCYGP